MRYCSHSHVSLYHKYLHKARDESGDVSVRAKVFGVEGQPVIDHGDDQPRVEHVQGSERDSCLQEEKAFVGDKYDLFLISGVSRRTISSLKAS